MSLEERIKRLEEENKPYKIRSWLDIVKFAQQKGKKTILIDGQWTELIRRIERDTDKRDKPSAHP